MIFDTSVKKKNKVKQEIGVRPVRVKAPRQINSTLSDKYEYNDYNNNKL